MGEIAAGDVVRITIQGTSADEVSAFGRALVADSETAALLTPLSDTRDARPQDFGTWELVQEFIVSGAGGAASAGLVEAIRALWKRGSDAGELPAIAGDGESQPGETPQPRTITVAIPVEGVTEIRIRVRRD